jgi:hypothetical protein
MAWIKVISLLIIIGIVGSVVAAEWPGQMSGPFFIGTRIFNGTADPGAGLGLPGDYYLNSLTGALFNKTVSSTWQFIMNLTGPNGTPGANGAANMTAGPQGPAGATGATGPTGPMNLTPNMTAGPEGPPGSGNYDASILNNLTIADQHISINISAEDGRLATNITKSYTDSLNNLSASETRRETNISLADIRREINQSLIDNRINSNLTTADSHISSNKTAAIDAAVLLADTHIASNLTVNNTLVSGPTSATADNIAVFNGVTGRIIKDGLSTIAQVITAATNAAVSTMSGLLATNMTKAYTDTNTNITKVYTDTNANITKAYTDSLNNLSASETRREINITAADTRREINQSLADARVAGNASATLLTADQHIATNASADRLAEDQKISINISAEDTRLAGNITKTYTDAYTNLTKWANITLMGQSWICENNGGCSYSAPNSTGSTGTAIQHWISLDFPLPTVSGGVNASIEYIMPSAWTGGAFYFTPDIMSSSGTGSVWWDTRCYCGLTYNSAYGTNVSGQTWIITTNTINRTKSAAVTCSGSPAASAHCWFQYRRLGGTLTTAAHYSGAQIAFPI